MSRPAYARLALLALILTACNSPAPSSGTLPPAVPPPPAISKDDAAFAGVVHELIEDVYRRHPTQATYLGVHKYDDRLEDYSKQAVADEANALRGFRERVSAIGTGALS